MTFRQPTLTNSQQRSLNSNLEQYLENVIHERERDLETYFQLVDTTIDKLTSYLRELFTRYSHYNNEDREMLIQRDLSLSFELRDIFSMLGLYVSEYAKHLEAILDELYVDTLGQAFDELNQFYFEELNEENVGITPEHQRIVVRDQAVNNYRPSVNMLTLIASQVIELRHHINNNLVEVDSIDTLTEWVKQRANYYKHRIRQATWTEPLRIVNDTLMLIMDLLNISHVQWLDATEQNFAMTTGAEVCDRCLSISNGGIRNRGIYRRATMRFRAPIHTNCRCIVVPFLGII